MSDKSPQSASMLPSLSANDVVALAAEFKHPNTELGLVINYIINNGLVKPKTVASLQKIYSSACSIGHDIWPKQIGALIKGRDVLDYGCGTTLYGAVFRALGAKSYLGIDPAINIESRIYRSRIKKGNVKIAINQEAVMNIIPNIEYVRSDFVDTKRRFDVVTLHTVTEHLLEIDKIFKGLSSTLRRGGRIWFLHDNFYSWAGHHMEPHSPRVLNLEKSDQRTYADWAHIKLASRPDHFDVPLNRIRIDDLRRVTEKYFHIEDWQEIPDEPKVIDRLTPEIEKSFEGFSRRELTTKHIVCRARRS